MLDEQATQYEAARNAEIEALQLTLEDVEGIVATSFENIKLNTDAIYEQIILTAQENGITLSNEITAPWKAGEEALGTYQETLGTKAGEFVTTLGTVESAEWGIQTQADKAAESIADGFNKDAQKTVDEAKRGEEELDQLDKDADDASKSIANTFSQKSDELVTQAKTGWQQMDDLDKKAQQGQRDISLLFSSDAEYLIRQLEQARDSADNLKLAADLADQALDRVGDGSFSASAVVGGLGSIASAAKEVAAAASEAAAALSSMGAARAAANAIGGGGDDKGTITSLYGKEGTDSRGTVSWNKDSQGRIQIKGRTYATGTKGVSRDELAWTQEEGPELIVSPSTGAVFTPLRKGDMVLPTEQTANMWSWSKFDPTEFAQKLLEQTLPAINGNSTVNTNTMQVQSLITVNGPVNDSREMLKIAAQEASSQIRQSFNTLNKGIH